MERASAVLEWVQAFSYISIAILAVARYLKRRDRASAWFALTFVVLGTVTGIALGIPEGSTSTTAVWATKLIVVLIVVFPYLLVRMTASFAPFSKRFEFFAGLATAAAAALVFAFERLPLEDETPSDAFRAYVYLVLVQWSVLLLRVAFRLWRSARGQASVARARMRTIALGAVGLAFAVVVSGAGSADESTTAISLVTQSLGIVAAFLFLLGFAPPGLIRAWWRRPEEQQVREASLALMEAETPEDVSSVLLPVCARMTSGSGAFIERADGSLLGTHGFSPEEAIEAAAGARRPGLLSIPLRSGKLWVEAGPYVPYFGREETNLLANLASLADLAFDRCDLLDRERRARKQMEEAQEIARTGSWEWDIKADRITWSDELFRLYEIDPETLDPSYESYISLVHPEDRDAMQQSVRSALETHEPFNLEHRIVSPSGKVTYNQARGRVVLDEDGRVARMVGTGHDITRRKRLELVRERFIANAAHELRTPLTSLLGLIEVLSTRRHKMTESQLEESIAVMSRGGRRLARLVNNLLDMTRLQEGREVEKVPVPLEPVVNEVLSANPPPEDRVLHVDVQEGLNVMADPAWMDQILSNLFSNAYKYGGANITVAAEESDEGVLIRVCDDGAGVDQDLRQNLFEPFSRGEGFQSVIGSGLGLALVKMVVEVLGGRLWYEDASPGACFCVLLEGAA